MAHPYYPVRHEIKGYLANASSTLTLLSIFAAGCLSVAMSAYILIMKLYPRTSFGDLWTIAAAFTFSSKTHACYDGCFWTAVEGVLTIGLSLSNAKRLRAVHGERNCLYLGSFVLYHGVSDSPRSVQLIVSLGQLYGVILYYATSLFDHYVLDITNTRPESLRFWGYFILCNAFWVIVPSSKFWLFAIYRGYL
ncbi:Emopamil-binding protein [Penicillium frequentans]|nr:Emopamil-binding protein [Penicillium glabrum]